MSQRSITRREALKAGAAVLPFSAAATALAKSTGSPESSPIIGVATTQFGQYTNAQVARELAAEGVRTVQLFLTQKDSNYWKYNGRSDLSDLTADRCKEIAAAYRSQGVRIHSLGVYTNLIHPDEAERAANVAYFEAMMKTGAHMNVDTFVTEAGHYHDATKPATPVEHHFQQEVWKMMVATGKELAKMAERYNATVLFEPFFRHFFASAKRTRVYLEEVGSPRLRALLDPANLLELNDLEEMFIQLGPYVDCLHAKDRKLHVDRGVPAGQGDLDYTKFVTLAAERTPKAPLILEYVGPNDFKQALAHLRNAIRQAGTSQR
ncbi:MAG: sugar phosphate isomerase/epimerase [Candidatus Nealsonbacteria bacterium]|nr:sugar phosphate isomerase/epimerase [Candidatus Nealsonbacteria bacterium]